MAVPNKKAKSDADIAESQTSHAGSMIDSINLDEEYLLLFGGDSPPGEIYDPTQPPAQQTQQRQKYLETTPATEKQPITARSSTYTTPKTGMSRSSSGIFTHPLPVGDSGVAGGSYRGSASLDLSTDLSRKNSGTSLDVADVKADLVELRKSLLASEKQTEMYKEKVQSMQDNVYMREGENSILREKLKQGDQQLDTLRQQLRAKQVEMTSSQNDMQSTLQREVQHLQSQLTFRKRDLEEAEALIRRMKRESAGMNSTQLSQTTPSQRPLKRAPGQPDFTTPQRATQHGKKFTPTKSQQHTRFSQTPGGQSSSHGSSSKDTLSPYPYLQSKAEFIQLGTADDAATTQGVHAVGRHERRVGIIQSDTKKAQHLIPRLLNGPPRPVFKLSRTVGASHMTRLQRNVHPAICIVTGPEIQSPLASPLNLHAKTVLPRYERRWVCDFGVLDLLNLVNGVTGWYSMCGRENSDQNVDGSLDEILKDSLRVGMNKRNTDRTEISNADVNDVFMNRNTANLTQRSRDHDRVTKVGDALMGVLTSGDTQTHLSGLLELFDNALRVGMRKLAEVLDTGNTDTMSKDRKAHSTDTGAIGTPIGMGETVLGSFDVGYDESDPDFEAIGNMCLERMVQVVRLLTMICQVSRDVRRLVVIGQCNSADSRRWQETTSADRKKAEQSTEAMRLRQSLSARGVVFGDSKPDILSMNANVNARASAGVDDIDPVRDGNVAEIITFPGNPDRSPTNEDPSPDAQTGPQPSPHSQQQDTFSPQLLITTILLSLACLPHHPHTNPTPPPPSYENNLESDFYLKKQALQDNPSDPPLPSLRPQLVHECRFAALECLSVLLVSRDGRANAFNEQANKGYDPHVKVSVNDRYEHYFGSLLLSFLRRVVPSVLISMEDPHNSNTTTTHTENKNNTKTTQHTHSYAQSTFASTSSSQARAAVRAHNQRSRSYIFPSPQDNYTAPSSANELYVPSLTTLLSTLMNLLSRSAFSCHGVYVESTNTENSHMQSPDEVAHTQPARAISLSSPSCLFVCGLVALHQPLRTPESYVLHLRAIQYTSVCVTACPHWHTCSKTRPHSQQPSSSRVSCNDGVDVTPLPLGLYLGVSTGSNSQKDASDNGSRSDDSSNIFTCNCAHAAIYRLVQALREYECVLTMNGSLPFPDDIASDASENDCRGESDSEGVIDMEDDEIESSQEKALPSSRKSFGRSKRRDKLSSEGPSLSLILREAFRLLEKLCDACSRENATELVEWISPFRMVFYSVSRRIILFVKSQPTIYPEGSKLHECMSSAQAILLLYNEICDRPEPMEDVLPG
eukprot:CFRG5122T1